jgi:hypothetical protein
MPSTAFTDAPFASRIFTASTWPAIEARWSASTPLLVANELVLSFVPDVEQRVWRTVMRTKYQARRNRVQLQNGLEALLEEAHGAC